MANSTVTLMLRIRTADRKRPFLKPVYAANGRIRPHYAFVNGRNALLSNQSREHERY